MRHFAKHAAPVVISLLLCVLAPEGGVRVYSAFCFPRMMQLDDDLGWKHVPNVSKVLENELASGYGTPQEYLSLGSGGLDHDPDLVLLIFENGDGRSQGQATGVS